MSTTGNSAMYSAPRYLAAGECAVVVEYGSVVDPKVNDQVLVMDVAVNQAGIKGVMRRLRLCGR